MVVLARCHRLILRNLPVDRICPRHLALLREAIPPILAIEVESIFPRDRLGLGTLSVGLVTLLISLLLLACLTAPAHRLEHRNKLPQLLPFAEILHLVWQQIKALPGLPPKERIDALKSPDF